MTTSDPYRERMLADMAAHNTIRAEWGLPPHETVEEYLDALVRSELLAKAWDAHQERLVFHLT